MCAPVVGALSLASGAMGAIGQHQSASAAAAAQNEGAMCIWDGSNWFLIGNQSVTTVA